MIELEHSPLGGSSAHRFINCEASFLLQREAIESGTYEDVPSEFAALGTSAHEVGALAVAEGAEPYQFVGQTFGDYTAGVEGEIDLNAIQIYFNECMAIRDAVSGRPHELLIERTFHLPEIHPLFKGTVDFGVITPVKLWLRDYKNGAGVGVGAVGSKQLLYYAALLIKSATIEFSRDTPVSLGIVQPNFYGLFEAPEVWETTVGFVLDWFNKELLPRMNHLYTRRTPVVDADFVAGEHCQFCPVLLDCTIMRRAFEKYAAGSEDFIAMLTNEELDTYYSQRDYARRFMKALDATVHARKVAGGNIPSAKLVEKQVARVWKPGGLAAIQAAFGDKSYAPRKPLSPAGVEKLSSRGKEIALEWGYKPDSAGLVVAPLSDPRPEAKRKDNAAIFAAHAAPPIAYEDF